MRGSWRNAAGDRAARRSGAVRRGRNGWNGWNGRFCAAAWGGHTLYRRTARGGIDNALRRRRYGRDRTARPMRGVTPIPYPAAMPNLATHDDADGHVIHLVSTLEPAPGEAPAALGLPRRLGPAGRAWCALAGAVVCVAAAGALFLLWTQPTPGLWFDLLFTVMLVGLAAAPWAILAASIRQAGFERDLQASWRDLRLRASAVQARVIERDWTLSEDGSVASFALTVRSADAALLRGRWRPADAIQGLLQTQVPGVGAEVRVWRIADAPAGAPLVIEAADPSVVA